MSVGLGCDRNDRPAREKTLPEEIKALKEYNVPDSVIDRIYRKLEECGELENRRIEARDFTIQELHNKNRNKDAIIDALGAYLAIKNDGHKREL